MTHITEKHFFKESGDFFNDKLDYFQEYHLGSCIMGADALNHTPIDEVAFIHNDTFDSVTCSRILNGLLNADPLIHIHSECFLNSTTTVNIFYLNNFSDIEDFYCIKTQFDFLVEGVMLYQIFEVKTKSLNILNDFWITNE